jgi:hypothetical protein
MLDLIRSFFLKLFDFHDHEPDFVQDGDIEYDGNLNLSLIVSGLSKQFCATNDRISGNEVNGDR